MIAPYLITSANPADSSRAGSVFNVVVSAIDGEVEIDGIVGDGTRSAIRRYQRANGLPADGHIDGQLLQSMGLG